MRDLLSLSKKQKINVLVLGLLAFIVIPLYTAVFLSFEDPITHSVTQLGFSSGYYALFLIWGILLAAYTVYAMIMVLKESQYKKAVIIVLYVLVGIMETAMIITGSVTNDPEVANGISRLVHNKAAMTMFISHMILMVIMTALSFFRSKIQGFSNLLFIGFFCIGMAYMYVRVTKTGKFTMNHAATALQEGSVFCLFVIFVFLNYVGNLLFLPKKTVLTELPTA